MSLHADLRVVEALGRRSLRQTFRRPQFLAPILLFPSLFLAVNTGGAGRAVELPGFPEVAGFLDFELAGAIVQSTMLAGVSGGIALALDVEMGFLDRLVAAPIARWAIVVGRLAGTAALGVVAAVWFLAGGLLFGAEVQAGPVGVLVVLVLAPLSALGFGGVGAALALWSGRASVVQGIFPLVFVIIFMSSAFFPREFLTEPARSLADWNPLSYVAEGIREPVAFGLSSGPLLRGLAGVAVLGALGAGVCALGLRSRLRAG